MGIDIETTGTDPARVYIIDAGFEFMNMISPRPAGEPAGYRYEQDYYETGDAYGQARLSFGVPAQNALLGNPLILDLTGIDVRDRASADFVCSTNGPKLRSDCCNDSNSSHMLRITPGSSIAFSC